MSQVNVWCAACYGTGKIQLVNGEHYCGSCGGKGYSECTIESKVQPYTITDAVADATVLRSLSELQVLEKTTMVNQVSRTIIERFHKFYCGEKEEG